MNLHLSKILQLLQVTFHTAITKRQLKQQQNIVNVTELKYFAMCQFILQKWRK